MAPMNKATSARAPSPNALLWQAVASGDREAGKAALAAGARPGTRHGCWSVLGKALRDDRVDMALDLIEAGSPVDQPDAHVSLLERAAYPQMDAAHALLVTRGAPLSTDALEMACRAGNGAAVERLLAAGCPVWGEGSAFQQTRAVVFCWPLKNGPAPEGLLATLRNLPDSRWVSAAISAAQNRRLDVWTLLVGEAGCSERAHALAFHAMQFNWQEGFDLACRPGTAGLRPKLPYPGSVVAACLQQLVHAKKRRPALERLKRVLEAGYPVDMGVPVHVHDNTERLLPLPIWWTGHHRGSAAELKQVLALLKTHGAELCARPEFTQMTEQATVLHQAIVGGHWKTVEWLGKCFRGFDWEAEGSGGLWPLMAARVNPVDAPRMQAALEGLSPLPDHAGLGAPLGGWPGNALHAVADRMLQSKVPLRGIPDAVLTPLLGLARSLVEKGVPLEDDIQGRGRACDRLMEAAPAWMATLALARRLDASLEGGQAQARARL